jgi:molybdate transport system ATP-binding protein
MIDSSEPRQFLQVHIGISFPTLTVDVELVADRREILGLAGANGAGKTSVLRAIAGLQPIDRGAITINGVLVDDAARNQFVASRDRRVGVVFQDYRLFPNLSTLENIAFGLRAQGKKRAEARRVASEWIERFGLSDHAHHKPHALSGGQSQRVALARALATEPDVLLLDEPLAAIDRSSRDEFRELLGTYLQTFDGVTVVVSHDPEDLDRLATRTIQLDRGRIVGADVDAEPYALPNEGI